MLPVTRQTGHLQVGCSRAVVKNEQSPTVTSREGRTSRSLEVDDRSRLLTQGRSRADHFLISQISATLHICQTMYRPKQFCTWHATSVTEFHPSQTDTDRGVVLPLPGCTRFVQTVACPLKMPSAVPRMGPCGERTLYGLLSHAFTTTMMTAHALYLITMEVVSIRSCSFSAAFLLVIMTY